ncbi:ribokinase [Promicromonospora xylanilytica]
MERTLRSVPASVWVVGSLNVDSSISVEQLVRPGETVRALAVERRPGGKGMNQAVAAAFKGASVRLLGAVGTDDAGELLLGALAGTTGLDASRVLRAPDVRTSEAMIQVDGAGENSIVVLPGANDANSPASVRDRLAGITPDDVLVCQLEIPHESVAAALSLAHERGARTILNAAPAAPVVHLLGDLDVLVVNEAEAAMLLDDDEPPVASRLRERFGCAVVLTLGPRGCQVADSSAEAEFDAPAVHAVDTTGAGDAFVGALAAALAAGQTLAEAGAAGNALASHVCTVPGAQGYTTATATVASPEKSERNMTWND